jgi:hypothetical protein
MIFEYCLVCNQLINSADVSLLREGRRVHIRCVDQRYHKTPGFPTHVDIIDKKKK